MTSTTTARSAWSPARVGAFALSVIVLAAGFALFSTRAVAAFVAVGENGLPGHLSLDADPHPTTLNPGFMTMSPGAVEHWQIKANLEDASSPLTMQFKRDGSLVQRPGTDGLIVQAQLCSEEWTGFPVAPSCAPGASAVFGPTPANSAVFGALAANSDPVPPGAPVYDLGTLSNAGNKFVLVTLSIPLTLDNQTDQSLMGLEASFGLGFTAEGSSDPQGGLAETGADFAALLLLALGALGLGLVLHSVHKARLALDGRNDS